MMSPPQITPIASSIIMTNTHHINTGYRDESGMATVVAVSRKMRTLPPATENGRLLYGSAYVSL